MTKADGILALCTVEVVLCLDLGCGEVLCIYLLDGEMNHKTEE